MPSAKTDNHNPAAKLALRRHFLRRYGPPHRVLDACQGNGLIWRALAKEFKLDLYWGLDLKPKPGRLKLDSSRYLARPGWLENVLDVDTYGSPWAHWESILANLPHDTTVFLTIGQVTMAGGTNLPKEALLALGLNLKKLKIPKSIMGKIAKLVPEYCLARAGRRGVNIVEAVESMNRGGHARYIGVRLTRKPTPPAPKVRRKRPV